MFVCCLFLFLFSILWATVSPFSYPHHLVTILLSTLHQLLFSVLFLFLFWILMFVFFFCLFVLYCLFVFWDFGPVSIHAPWAWCISNMVLEMWLSNSFRLLMVQDHTCIILNLVLHRYFYYISYTGGHYDPPLEIRN